MKKKWWLVILILSVSTIALMGFVAFTLLIENYLFKSLVEQAAKDNRVIGESILNLLEKTNKSDSTNMLIPKMQNVCDVLKLPNGGFVCVADPNGNIVAIPGFTPESEAINIGEATISTLDRSESANYLKAAKDSVFEGFYEYEGTTYSDVVVGLPHQSGLIILVHQDNNEIKKQSAMYSKFLYTIGLLISVLIGLITYLVASWIIKQYNNIIRLQNNQITLAMNEITDKNQRLNSSIQYAKRIQTAMLPFEDRIGHSLGKDNFFILYMPKDVVSGDFYFFEQVNNKLVWIVADCTGHGVPGALMSMIGMNILEEVVMTKANTTPDEILGKLHKRIRFALKQGETQNRDGMDVGVCVLDIENNILEFAGANNPLFIVQNEKMEEYKGDSKSIGGQQNEEERKFKKHRLGISKPAMLYMFSDGFKDQFGGEDNKKFMSKRFKEVLLSISGQPLQEQHLILKNTIEDWKGDKYAQTDDILVMGIKIG